MLRFFSSYQFPSKNIIGIGLGGAESKGPCRDYQAVFELAKKEEYRGALDFLNSRHSLFFNKQNLKDIKKLEKIIKKID